MAVHCARATAAAGAYCGSADRRAHSGALARSFMHMMLGLAITVKLLAQSVCGVEVHPPLRATPRDWARLGMLVLDGGRRGREQVLPKGWIETMATPSARNSSYGLGLWLRGPDFMSRAHFTGRRVVGSFTPSLDRR